MSHGLVGAVQVFGNLALELVALRDRLSPSVRPRDCALLLVLVLVVSP